MNHLAQRLVPNTVSWARIDVGHTRKANTDNLADADVRGAAACDAAAAVWADMIYTDKGLVGTGRLIDHDVGMCRLESLQRRILRHPRHDRML